MRLNIAHYESPRKPPLSYHGMAPVFAMRNILAMAGNNLKELRKRAGLKQADIAEAMGVSVPQVSRWESGNDNIPSQRLPSLASAYRSSIGEMFEEQLGIQQIGPTLFVKGEVQAGHWVDAYEWPEDQWLTAPGRSDVTVPLEYRFYLRVVGESMNSLYPHGTFVECIKLMAGGEIESGKRYVVIREREDFELEATVKEFVLDEAGIPWLWPRSFHPEFQSPWRIDVPQEGIRKITIVAKVVGSYRPE